jgi:beta-N-acetylhexosaminidase
VQRAASRARHAPPLIAAVQPGGASGAVPHAPPSQALMPDADAARELSADAGRRLHRLGIRLALAPVADVGTVGGPWEGRAFSDDPVVVARMAAAAVAGWKDAGVAPAPGHFPGEGAASRDPSLGSATVGLSLDELGVRDLRPFATIVDDAPVIQMTSASYAAFDGVTPATLLPRAFALLRKDLGFRGVIVSGDLAAASLGSGAPIADVAVDALKAGADLLWVPGDAADQDAAWRGVVQAVRAGEVPAERVAEALKRVTLLRATYGVR